MKWPRRKFRRGLVRPRLVTLQSASDPFHDFENVINAVAFIPTIRLIRLGFVAMDFVFLCRYHPVAIDVGGGGGIE